MKNQYFGDLNDYRKYGLLRLLLQGSGLSATVCWMLTPDDGRPDGGLTQYLQCPQRWRAYDPELFDFLLDRVARRRQRDITAMERAGLLPGCRFFRAITPETRKERLLWFRRLLAAAHGHDLLFLDPDNGMEVPSVPPGRRGSAKYLFWDELEAATADHSVLVYQHFRRTSRDRFIAEMASAICKRAGAREVISFSTPRVAYFLAPMPSHGRALWRGTFRIRTAWQGQILIARHPA